MKIGILLSHPERIEEQFDIIAPMRFETCQIYCGPMTDRYSTLIQNRTRDLGLEITTMVLPMAGYHSYKYPENYVTLGLVPESLRWMRLEAFREGALYADSLGVKNLLTHIGFISDNPFDRTRLEIEYLLGHFCDELKQRGQNLLLETGEILPVTVVQMIARINRDNLFLNFDPCNLTSSGRANACDAMDLLHRWVRDFHAKDGTRPAGIEPKGHETRMGEGEVDFPTLIRKLKQSGYEGSLTIERELAGGDEAADLRLAKACLEQWI